MKAEFRILKYNSRDFKESLDLRNRLLRIPLGLSLFDEDLEEEVNDIHIGGFIDDKLVSCLVLRGNKPLSKMRQVAVEEEFQGKGIGKEMVLFAEDWLKSNGYPTVYCHARDIAVPFYLMLNYKKDGSPFTEVGIVHFKMTKELA